MRNLLLFFAAITICFASCKKGEEGEPLKTVYKVQYNIGCTDCQVVYISDTLGTQTVENNRNSSWTYSFYGKKNQEILLLAYNTSSAPQGVNARITVNDSILQDRTTYCPINGISFVVDTIQ